MKKMFLVILAVIVLIVMALVFGRNILARTIVVNGIKQVCGLKIDLQKVDINLPKVAILGLKVYSPEGFNNSVLADIPEISLDIDLPGVLKNKIHLSKLKIDVREMNLELNEQGKLNVNSLALLLPKPTGGKPPEIKIDELSIKVGKVSYKGYLPAAGVKTMEFNPNIDETLHDVTDPAKVTKEILQKIISRIGIGSFTTFSVKDTVEGFKGLFNLK